VKPTLTRSLADAKRIPPLRIGPIAESFWARSCGAMVFAMAADLLRITRRRNPRHARDRPGRWRHPHRADGDHGGRLASESRTPAVAQVLFVALLTVASYVMAFGGVGSAALDSAVAHFVLPAAAAPLLLGAALRSGVVAGLGPAGTAPTSRSFSSPPG